MSSVEYFEENVIPLTFEFEGGYVNDPDDPGGETYRGISKRAYPHLIISKLTDQDVIDIYFADYWMKCKCNRHRDRIAHLVFDFAVHSGVETAIKYAQKTVNELYNQEILKVDGIPGPITVLEIDKVSVYEFNMIYYDMRLGHLSMIVQRNVRLLKFLPGWINRLVKLNRQVNYA